MPCFILDIELVMDCDRYNNQKISVILLWMKLKVQYWSNQTLLIATICNFYLTFPIDFISICPFTTGSFQFPSAVTIRQFKIKKCIFSSKWMRMYRTDSTASLICGDRLQHQLVVWSARRFPVSKFRKARGN